MAKLIKRKPSKICPCCLKRFFRKKGFSNPTWEKQKYCSIKCSKLKVPIEEYKQQLLKFILSNTITTELGCMEWQGCIGTGGYPQISFLAKPESGSRIIWELINGEIPNKLWVLHSCDNRKCINTKHLFLGNRQTNVDDMVQKERHFHKINKEQNIQIIQLAKEGILYKDIAKEFNVHQRTIRRLAISNDIRRYKRV